MKIILASSSLLALPTFDALRNSSQSEIVGLISTPDQAKGRSGSKTPNDFSQWASANYPNIALEKPDNNEELFKSLTKLNAELVIAIAYGKLIKDRALSQPRFGWINLHFSLLPRWRGAAPVQRAILAQDDSFGITVFKIDQGLDTGAIFHQREIKVDPNENATSILSLLSIEGSNLVAETVVALANGDDPTPQEGEPTVAPKIEKAELKVNVSAGISSLQRQVRAFTEDPGVWFQFRDKRHVITSAKKSHHILSKAAIANVEGTLLIGTGDGALEILSLIPEGRREMTGAEYLRGARIELGDSIEK
jgi:methionyl-tRNA formyltransferase